MAVVINGTTGITSVNGSAAAPSVTGADTDTGIVYGTNTLSLATGGTTAVTVDSSQNVGIGTSSPAAKLHVYGTGDIYSRVQATGDTNAMSYYTNSQRSWLVGGLGNASGALGFYDLTAGAERMRIDSSGKLLVAKTSATGNSNLQVSTTAGGNSGIAIAGTTTGTNYAILFYTSDGVDHGYISYTTSGTSYNTTSDYRLKENIAPMTGALSVVQQLKPCTYTWKSDGSAGQGFIAHELAEVVPDCVTGEKDAVNEDGSIRAQGIDTSFLVATLTAAIQELKAEFDAYKAAHP